MSLLEKRHIHYIDMYLDIVCGGSKCRFTAWKGHMAVRVTTFTFHWIKPQLFLGWAYWRTCLKGNSWTRRISIEYCFKESYFSNILVVFQTLVQSRIDKMVYLYISICIYCVTRPQVNQDLKGIICHDTMCMICVHVCMRWITWCYGIRVLF